MRQPFLFLVCLLGLASCGATAARLAGDTDASCIHRLYDYPARSEPFQAAASTCAPGRTVDLTGDHYYQLLATSLNMPFVNRDPKRGDSIVLTGSRIPQPTDQVPPPELSLH